MNFEKNKVNEKFHDSIIFNEMDVTDCCCKIGSVSFPENWMTFNYDAIKYSVANKEIVDFKRNYNGLLDSIKPYVSHRKFKINYRIHKFDTRYQRDHIGAQAVQLNFKFVRGVADIMSWVSAN